MTRRWMLACLVLIAAAGNQAGTTQPPQPPDPLFTPSPAGVADRASATGPEQPTARSRPTRVALDRLINERLRLNLFADVTLEADRRTSERLRDGAWLWAGRVVDDPLSTVTLVRDGAMIQGSVRAAAGSFTIEPIGAGPDHLIRQIDPTQMPVELPPLVPPALPAAGAAAPTIERDGPESIDVLVVYTQAARQQAGGTEAAVRARIDLGVAETNAAYANSGVYQRLRLLGSELIGYRESGDLSIDLRALTADDDGLMDVVHARRNAVGADLVQLVVGSSAGGACGVAWVMQELSISFAAYGFSVTAYPCISPNYTFGHELGHNMGSAHAPEDGNAPPVFPYSFGYKDPGQAFRTVMAYDCPAGCPRVLHFSNPGVSYLGRPTGTAGLHDNGLSLNQTAATVANFRASRRDHTILGAPTNLHLEAEAERTTVRLSWSPPSEGTPTAYLIEVGTAEGLANIATLVSPAGSTSYVQEQVPAGSYFIRVRALDDFGPSAPSNSVHLVMTRLGNASSPRARRSCSRPSSPAVS